jgi:ribose transport system substrate-binding protein
MYAATVHAQRDVIAFVQDNMGNDFRHAQVMEAKNEAQKRGLNFVYTDAQGQTSRLISQMNDLIGQQVGVIILGTNDDKAVVPIVAKAEKAGVRVVVLDRGIAGKAYTTFINSDNVKIGEMGADYLGKKLGGKGTVLLFEGLKTADVTHLRTQGFLKGVLAYPNIKVLRRTGNYLRKDAIQETEKLLAAGIRFDAVFSESDSMLSGVRMVLEKNKIDPRSIVMAGVDYTSEARDAILAKTQSASVMFPLGGRQAVSVAQDLLKGRKVARHISIPVLLVTPENVDQVQPIF